MVGAQALGRLVCVSMAWFELCSELGTLLTRSAPGVETPSDEQSVLAEVSITVCS